jgi:S-adenosylhomocysteine hydrolase
MSLFEQAEGIFNGTRELRTLSVDLYQLSKHIQMLERAILATKDWTRRVQLFHQYKESVHLFAAKAKAYTDYLVKINAHLGAASKSLNNSGKDLSKRLTSERELHMRMVQRQRKAQRVSSCGAKTVTLV